jgi:dTDP-4-dehydrorhamnose reductase
VVHSAAASDPDACERDPESAFRINFEATRGLALLAREVGSRVIFISTDLVFDGAKGNYSEQDQPCPLGVYAASKLRAEAAILEAGDPDLVLRSALIYGFAGPVAKTFLGRMLETLAGGCRIHLFTDQRRSPVLVDDLARGIILAIEQDLSGLYHLGGAEAVSRYEFGQQACRVFGCNEELLVPASQEDFALPAPRPLDATLDSGKFARATGFVPCGVGEGLDLAKRGRASIV